MKTIYEAWALSWVAAAIEASTEGRVWFQLRTTSYPTRRQLRRDELEAGFDGRWLGR